MKVNLHNGKCLLVSKPWNTPMKAALFRSATALDDRKTDSGKMKKIYELSSKRLILRQWRQSDKIEFAHINADPQVMEFYPNTLSRAESDRLAQRFQDLITEKGWGFWALQHKDDGNFMGFVGLHVPAYDLPAKDCVEIGWRLSREYWGRGYATEAATASLNFAFETLKLDAIYSFTPVINKRSWAVMERLGMVNTGQNFSHPMVPIDSPLSEHFLYKIDQKTWQDTR